MTDILLLLLAVWVLLLALLFALLLKPPVVPRQLSTWPSLGYLYTQLVRSALKKKAAPVNLVGKPIQVSLTKPAVLDARRYAAYLKLVGYKSIPPQIPLSYLFVESFRLTMLAMAHPDFPFNVLGSVLTRNCSTLYRPLAATEALTYSACVDPQYTKNDKGDTEINIVCTATDSSNTEVWHNTLTVLVIDPKRQRGGGTSKPKDDLKAVPGHTSSGARQLLAELKVPANVGRQYGALSGDRNPIHIHALLSQLFGFKRPIAHAMYLVGRLEAELQNAGFGVTSFPATFNTEFKRPTLLPAKLQATVSPETQPPLQCAVITGDGLKDVIVGRLHSRR